MQVGGAPRGGIHIDRFKNCGSVRQIPRLLKNDVRAGRAKFSIVILVAAVLKTKAQRVLADELGEHVTEGKRILRENSRRGVSLRSAINDALPRRQGALYFSSGNRPVDLRIG